MNLRVQTLFVLLLVCIACAKRTTPVVAVEADGEVGSSTLMVRVLGIESEDGEIAIALYDSAERFKKRSEPIAKVRLAPSKGATLWTAEGLDPGRYAVAAYHDLDADGELNRSTLGPPDEPYGFSNNARGTFGPPKFDQAAFPLAPGEHTIEITLRSKNFRCFLHSPG